MNSLILLLTFRLSVLGKPKLHAQKSSPYSAFPESLDPASPRENAEDLLINYYTCQSLSFFFTCPKIVELSEKISKNINEVEEIVDYREGTNLKIILNASTSARGLQPNKYSTDLARILFSEEKTFENNLKTKDVNTLAKQAIKFLESSSKVSRRTRELFDTTFRLGYSTSDNVKHLLPSYLIELPHSQKNFDNALIQFFARVEPNFLEKVRNHQPHPSFKITRPSALLVFSVSEPKASTPNFMGKRYSSLESLPEAFNFKSFVEVEADFWYRIQRIFVRCNYQDVTENYRIYYRNQSMFARRKLDSSGNSSFVAFLDEWNTMKSACDVELAIYEYFINSSVPRAIQNTSEIPVSNSNSQRAGLPQGNQDLAMQSPENKRHRTENSGKRNSSRDSSPSDKSAVGLKVLAEKACNLVVLPMTNNQKLPRIDNFRNFISDTLGVSTTRDINTHPIVLKILTSREEQKAREVFLQNYKKRCKRILILTQSPPEIKERREFLVLAALVTIEDSTSTDVDTKYIEYFVKTLDKNLEEIDTNSLKESRVLAFCLLVRDFLLKANKKHNIALPSNFRKCGLLDKNYGFSPNINYEKVFRENLLKGNLGAELMKNLDRIDQLTLENVGSIDPALANLLAQEILRFICNYFNNNNSFLY